MTGPGWTCLGALAAAAVLLTGCGPSQEAPVRSATRGFYTAVAAHDGPAACRALAPRTRSELEQSTGKQCEKGLFDEDVPAVGDPEQVSVFGTMAQVRYGNETAFLTRFQDGWRVLAAGCTPTTTGRFDCRISGD